MAKEKGSPGGGHGFSIDLDDSLIADALAAVERRLDKPEEPPAPTPQALEPDERPADDLDEEDSETWDGYEGDDLDELIMPLGPAEGMPSQADDADIQVPTRAQLLALNSQLGEELESLERDRDRAAGELADRERSLDRVRADRDEAQERAREALRKAGVLVIKARRKDEMIEQLRLDLQDARVMIRQREQVIRDLRDAIKQESQARDRMQLRHGREAAESKRFANEKLLKDLLPVMDHMELALTYADADPARIREGVDITWKQLLAVLGRAGLQRVGLSVGDPFDPELQEAMEHLDHDTIPANHVVQIHQHGYRLAGRLIRAARVGVSSDRERAPIDKDRGEPAAEE